MFAPGLLFLLLFLILPLLLLLVHSFYIHPKGAGIYQAGFTLENYIRFFTDKFYFDKILVTLKFSVIVTLITLLLGYPLAYFLAKIRVEVRKFLILVPLSILYISYIILTFAWQIILSTNGVLNSLLSALGLPKASLYPGAWAVIIGLVYIFLPFCVITIYSSILRIDRALEEASQILGANNLQTFLKITLPLSRNAIIAAGVMVFVLTVGAYITPVMLGKPRDWFLSNIIGSQIINELNVPFASVLSIMLLLLVGFTLLLFARLLNIKAILGEVE